MVETGVEGEVFGEVEGGEETGKGKVRKGKERESLCFLFLFLFHSISSHH